MQLFGGKFNFVVMQDHDKLRSNFDTFWDSLLTVFQVTASFSHSFSERLEPLRLLASLYVKRIPARLRQRRVSLLQTADFALLCTCTAFPNVSIHPLKSAAPAFNKTIIIKPLRMHTVHRCGLLLQSIAWYLSLCKCVYIFSVCLCMCLLYPDPTNQSCLCRVCLGSVKWIPDSSRLSPTENMKSEQHTSSNCPHTATPGTTQTGLFCRVWRTV